MDTELLEGEGYILLFYISQFLAIKHKKKFWQSGNKTARAVKHGTVRGLIGSAKKGLWRTCIGGLGAKINQQSNRHLCEITRGPPPLAGPSGIFLDCSAVLALHTYDNTPPDTLGLKKIDTKRER